MEQFDTLIQVLTSQFVEIMQNNIEYYSKYNFILSNEQQFEYKNENDELDENDIYIVVSFQPATLSYGLSIIPFTFEVVGTANKIEPTQRLLFEYAQQYNLKNKVYLKDGVITQTYSTPTIVNNFNDIYDGMRSMFMMGGTFLIGENTSNLETLTINVNGEEIKIEPLSVSTNFTVQLDTQATYNSNNITRSISKIGTKTLTFTVYEKNNAFFDLLKAIEYEMLDIAPNGINTDFTFTFHYIGKDQLYTQTYKLVNHTTQQNIGEMAVASLTFTR